MSLSATPAKRLAPAIQTHLLGRVRWDHCLALQQRLVYESTGRADGQIVILLCEHAPIITIGRQGTRSHVGYTDAELRSRGLELRWVNRGGGTLLHGPGQIAIYPIVPLYWHGWSVGQYIQRLSTAIGRTLARLNFTGVQQRRHCGFWGRTGQLAAVGAAVKNWTTYHGAYLNVDLRTEPCRALRTDPQADGRMSSLAVERRGAARITAVRSQLVRELADAFGCDRYHLYTGHPLWKSVAPEPLKATVHAG
mgnify:CR=1 FL=1